LTKLQSSKFKGGNVFLRHSVDYTAINTITFIIYRGGEATR